MKTKPLDDLELYELIVAAYPDKFDEDKDGDIWDEVNDFADSISGIDAISDLLARVTMMTMPMSSAVTGNLTHVLGKVELHGGQAFMTAAVKRGVEEDQ